MPIELYVFPPSPRSFKVLLVANHLGLDVTLHHVDLAKGEQKAADYAALNPNRRAPTLKDGDFTLWESNAIVQYLALQRPETGLLPQDDVTRIDMTRWQFWDLAHWDPACAVFAFEYVAKPLLLGIKDPDMAAVAKGTETFHRVARVLDAQLAGRRYCMGDTLTVADFSLAAPLNLAPMARYPLEAYSEINRWHASLASLPAWQKTAALAHLRT